MVFLSTLKYAYSRFQFYLEVLMAWTKTFFFVFYKVDNEERALNFAQNGRSWADVSSVIIFFFVCMSTLTGTQIKRNRGALLMRIARIPDLLCQYAEKIPI